MVADTSEQSHAKCEHCMNPVVEFEDQDSDEAWNNDQGAHDCEPCGSVICTACALSKQIHDEHNPGWQCPECFQDNIFDT